MDFESYMIVFTKSKERVYNFNKIKSFFNQLQMFEAYDGNDIKSKNIAYNQKLLLPNYFDKYLPGMLGCALSHIKLIEHFYKTSSKNWLLVLEDDVCLKNFDIKVINDIIKKADDNNSNFIQLYMRSNIIEKQRIQKIISENLYNMIPQVGTVAYLVSKNGYDIIKKQFPVNIAIDHFYSKHISKLNSLAYINTIFLNNGSYNYSDQNSSLGSIIGNIPPKINFIQPKPIQSKPIQPKPIQPKVIKSKLKKNNLVGLKKLLISKFIRK